MSNLTGCPRCDTKDVHKRHDHRQPANPGTTYDFMYEEESWNRVLDCLDRLDETSTPKLSRREKAMMPSTPLEEELLEKIKRNEVFPSGSDNKSVRNALTRLRRNGLIVNIGTRSRPIWKCGDSANTTTCR